RGRVFSLVSISPKIFKMGLSELESPTSPLSGVRSNQLSYRPFIQLKAGEEDRTPDNSLEGCSFTTKLHPHNLTTPTGFEPAISSVTGRRGNRYTTGPIYILFQLRG